MIPLIILLRFHLYFNDVTQYRAPGRTRLYPSVTFTAPARRFFLLNHTYWNLRWDRGFRDSNRTPTYAPNKPSDNIWHCTCDGYL